MSSAGVGGIEIVVDKDSIVERQCELGRYWVMGIKKELRNAEERVYLLTLETGSFP